VKWPVGLAEQIMTALTRGTGARAERGAPTP